MAARPYWDHPRLHLVKYEDLVSDSENTLKGVCEFLDLPYDSEMLSFHEQKENWYTEEMVRPKSIKSNEDHNNLRNWQVNQPIFDGRGRWEKEMNKAELRAFDKSCSWLMSELGYDDE